MLDTREIYSLSDFVRNPKAHVAWLKETHTPEVLTVNGRAEVVLLQEEVSEEEIKRSHAIVNEIMAETERLGLYL